MFRLRNFVAARTTRALLAGVVTLASIAAIATTAATATAGAAAGPALAVDVSQDRHAISPGIYGMNFADATLAGQIGLPVDRRGGNGTERYNYLEGVSNTGSDWYFENIADCFGGEHNWCGDADHAAVRSYQEFIAKDRAAGADTLMALPLTGYVATNPTYGHPLRCGFPKTALATQDDFDPWDANCGNGQQSGSWLTPPAPLTTTSRAWGPADNAGWVDDITARYGGIGYYELGNEPALWNYTHHDVHPSPVTYDELWQRTRDNAIAVRQHAPNANILALSEWGWPNYFCSGYDTSVGYCSASSPDRAAHGGTPLAQWLLQQAKAYQDAHGTRLIDYLDLHYYNQGGATTDVTRSLWDPSYTDPTWINDQIDLIPRMKQWVSAAYPGTKISLSEYDLSVPGGTANKSTLDVLIEADALGIFAREGLDLATRWGPPAATDELANAWRIYRDYDGQGGRFGGTWVRSTSANQSQLAVYSAQRAGDGALTTVVVNKTASDLTSSLSLAGFTPNGAAKVYRWSGAGVVAVADQAMTAGGFTATYPARSITMIVAPSTGGAPPADPTPPVGPTSPGGTPARVDVTPPVVSGLVSSAGTSTTARSTVISFIANDDSGAAPDCTPSSGATVALAVGRNTITVTCRDAAGNAAGASIVVRRRAARRGRITAIRLSRPSVVSSSTCGDTVDLYVELNDPAAIVVRVQRRRHARVRTVLSRRPRPIRDNYQLALTGCAHRRPLAPGRYAVVVTVDGDTAANVLALRVTR